MMYQDVVRSRRSVRDLCQMLRFLKRNYTTIIEEAMFAPNSTNLNSWRFNCHRKKKKSSLRSFDATTSS